MENKKGIIIGYIVLIFFVILFGGFIVYDKIILKVNEETQQMVTIGDVEINPNAFYQVNNTLRKLDRAFNYEDSPFYAYVYKNEKLNIKDFEPDVAIYAAMRDRMVTNAEGKIISEPVVKKDYEEMFGDNLKYTQKEIKAGDNHKIVYNQATGYTYVCNNIIESYTPGIVTINSKTSVENGYVTVTRKVFYVEYTANEAGVVSVATIYSDYSKKNKLGSVDVIKKGLNPDEVLGKFSSKISTYDFIFKENDNNTNYAIYKIQRTK